MIWPCSAKRNAYEGGTSASQHTRLLTWKKENRNKWYILCSDYYDTANENNATSQDHKSRLHFYFLILRLFYFFII